VLHLLHDTEAAEVDEKTFYPPAERGGTKISPAFEWGRTAPDPTYPRPKYNVYIFYFGDGENTAYPTDDNQRVEEILQTARPNDIN